MQRGNPFEPRHPFAEFPFEVFYHGEWKTVERLQISNGIIAFSLAGIGYLIDQRGLLSSLRLRPRKATSSDCTCFLRPGIDVRLLCISKHSEDLQEELLHPEVWVDAKISSIERKPHEPECRCSFYVKHYKEDRPGIARRTPDKDVNKVGIEQISIFQKLGLRPCEDVHYRWDFAEDSPTAQRTKLFLGKFMSDLSWLLLTSVQKQFAFEVRSIGNKIIYQILDVSFDNCSLDIHFSALNFKMDGELSVPVVFPFMSMDVLDGTHDIHDVDVDEVSPLSCDPAALRRSRRRIIQPERYLGAIGLEEVDLTALRIGYKSLKIKEEMSVVLYNGCADDLGNLLEGGEPSSFQINENLLVKVEEEDSQGEFESHPLPMISLCDGSNNQTGDEQTHLLAEIGTNEMRDDVPLKYYVRRRKKEDPVESICPSELGTVENHSGVVEAIVSNDESQKELKVSKEKPGGRKRGRPRKKNHLDDAMRPEASPSKAEGLREETLEKKLGAKRGRPLGSTKDRRLMIEEAQIELKLSNKKRYHAVASIRDWNYAGDDSKWDGLLPKDRDRKKEKFSSKVVPLYGRRYNPFTVSRKDRDKEVGGTKKRTLDAGAYKDIITAYMKKIQTTIEGKQPQSADPWRQILEATTTTNEKHAAEEEKTKEDEGEDSETEMLWREMELCLASLYMIEDNEASAEELQGSGKDGKWFCCHEFKLDDEVGLLCPLCGYVLTEIRDVSPPFLRASGFAMKQERGEKDDLEHKLIDEVGMDLVCNPCCSETPFSESNENVWGLIPDIRKKLHLHQKRAYEFLWRNIAGSLVPSEMKPSGKKIGGCVISHSPGAGKTFLIIAFLMSYLKLFPGKRPLVLAPKTTLYTWYKEIIKWEFPVPVYQIHGRRTYRDRIYARKLEGSPSSNLVPSGDVMHILDCLEKLQKWHAHPSVLLMGYTSFMTLMREDSKYAYRRYMGKLLRESPGILVLDEGHNPRSTKSRLRKALMRIETDIRILLSGTLFQNNFGEYFNTLCLARPKFVNEVLRKIDPKYERKKNGVKKTRTSIENRARKVFVDTIGRNINSSDPGERQEGIKLLKSLTNRFIDVYEGGSSENLPGLQMYTLMMKPTPMQQEILVKLHKLMNLSKGFPLELELMITLGSIHPWLMRTAVCANKFLTTEELYLLDEYKLDPSKGSKVKFVLGLVHRSIIRREKVLIFCHNIAPINLFLELFDRIYGWRKGEEVLVLQGDLELFERGRVMDKFEERGGPSKVMLASINACAEGISLTAASRVILLDSEWNPSKQKQAIARAFRPGQEKIVYVYQLLASGTLEEDKYGRTTWKEWVSCMIFSEELVEDPSRWQAEKIEDALLREIVEEDRAKLFHMIMKNEKTSYENPLARVNDYS
ncbi:SNF2 domain-containing protein CLASSY [Dionaea muscipula]